MYYWKIWRETRVRFFALLMLALSAGWLAWIQVSDVVTRAGFELGQPLPAELASLVWARGMTLLAGVGGAVAYMIGLVVGSGGLGEEIELGTAGFLLTRPRSRGYFVWSSWLAWGVELLASTSIMMLAGYATFFYMTRHTGPRNFPLIAPAIMITGLLAVGMAQLLTTATRRSKNAVAGGLAVTMIYLAAFFALKLYHIVSLPLPGNMYGVHWNSALAGAMLGWFATAVAFIGVSHLIVTRTEV